MKLTLAITIPLVISILGAATSAEPLSRQLFKFQSKRDFALFDFAGARWDSSESGIVFEPKGAGDDERGVPVGTVTSPEFAPGFRFDEVVLSWNAVAPSGSYVKVYLQVRQGDVWSRRFTYVIWNQDNTPWKRQSVRGQKDGIAELNADILNLNKPADAVRISAALCSSDGRVYPTLRLLTAHVIDTKTPLSDVRAKKSVWGKDLDVPQLSQLSVPDGIRFCSATSTAMVLSYWAQKLGRPELTCGVQQAVDGIYDIGWGGTGCWPFNTAFAGTFDGMRAYVTRFTSTKDIEEWIDKGVPVIVSLNYDKLRAKDGDSGHLMVMRGFEADGKCVLNDPNTRLDLGRNGRVVYSREALEAAWLMNPGSWGTVYLIYPDGWSIPRNTARNW